MHVNLFAEPKRDYKTLKFIGAVPPRQKLKHKHKPYHRNQSSNVQRLGVYRSILLDIAGNEFAVVEPSKSNVDKTIASFDDAKYSDFRDECFSNACSFLEFEYGGLLDDAIANSEELSEMIDWNKSGGYTSTYYHIQTKGDYCDWETDRKSTRLNSSHSGESRMPASA